MRRLLVTSTALVLLLAVPGATAAQEASPEVTGSASPVPSDEVAERLPVADYWNEWADHKEVSRSRAVGAVASAKHAGRKAARIYRKAVAVHDDELEWLDNHAPEACYSAEYEQWREATEELRSVHKRTVRQGIRRTRKQQRAAIKRLDRVFSHISDCLESAATVAKAAASGNPFVGSWVGRDDWVNSEGLHDTSRLRLRIDQSGRFLLRDPRAGICHLFGHGYVPATVRGSGEFVTDGSPEFRWRSGKLHCYPRGAGRKLITPTHSEMRRYDATADVLVVPEFSGCMWRAKTGSPKDCKAFWRGTPASVEDRSAPVDPAAPEQETLLDLVGLDAAAAARALSEAGLVGVPKEVFSDSVPAGEVISQGLAPGTDVDVGRNIAYVVSRGPEQTGD